MRCGEKLDYTASWDTAAKVRVICQSPSGDVLFDFITYLIPPRHWLDVWIRIMGSGSKTYKGFAGFGWTILIFYTGFTLCGSKSGPFCFWRRCGITFSSLDLLQLSFCAA
jgi:hypothetical protein